jgi:hypothetical protein
LPRFDSGASFMKDAKAVRGELERRVGRRQTARDKLAKEDAELVAYLREIQQGDSLTMQEAAEIVGVSRVMLYKMLKN